MISLRVNNSGWMPWYYSIKHFNMFIIDFVACLKTLKMLLKLMITHPEDQEVSAKEDLRLIVILLDRQCVATSVWMEKMKRTQNNWFAWFWLTSRVNNHSKINSSTSSSMSSTISRNRLRIACWRQSCYVERTRVPGVNFLTQNRKKIVEVEDTSMTHQENKRDWCQF